MISNKLLVPKQKRKGYHKVSRLSFRDSSHLNKIVKELVHKDRPIAFYGWGVSGMVGRVDEKSESQKFWLFKNNRPLGAKIPLLEPPEYAVNHIDWQKVHPKFRYLKDPKQLKKLWSSKFPFHLIFPYRIEGNSLNQSVVTPAFDKEVAPDTPTPTFCLFWVEDPALIALINEVKKTGEDIYLGVSSLNDHGEQPPFNTSELETYLKKKKIGHYSMIVEDPLLEPLDIASSHSQFVAPLNNQEPVWTMKRKGSLSADGFSKSTGLPVKVATDIKVAARRESYEIELDDKLFQAADKIKGWGV